MTTNKLAISSVVASDTNTYFCDVTLGTGISAPLLTATTVNYTVLDSAPVVTAPAALVSRVAATVDVMPTATLVPTSWSATGLPDGTKINTATGRITGTFTTAKNYTAKIKATNLFGASAEASWSVNVVALPATGNFIALLNRDANTNANLGGKLDLAVTSTGAFSGGLMLPVTRLPFTGSLSGAAGTNPVATLVVPKSGFTLTLSLDKDTGVLSTTVQRGLDTVTGVGVGQAPADKLKRVGAYNFALMPDVTSPTGSPEGDGYGQFSVDATGKLTLAGMLPDGTAYTMATFTGASGDIPLYTPQYLGKGSVMGLLKLNEDITTSYVNNAITGAPTWYKGMDSASRSYAGGIALMTLNADGGKYAAPVSPDIVMGLHQGSGNAKMSFTGANLASASRHPSVDFSVSTPAKVTPPPINPAATTLVFDAAKGLFSGQFTLVDSDLTVTPHVSVPRIVPYNGIIIRPGGSSTLMEGHGFFNLAQMPTATPKTTPTTSPKLSGLVTLTK